MSCCNCIKCGNMVGDWEKYCDACVRKYNLDAVQVLTYRDRPTTKEGREESFRKDLKTVGNLKPKPDSFVNKINVYTCQLGHRTVTVDRAPGTTSMKIRCAHKDGKKRCKEFATSAWYRVDQTLEPTLEWYVPAANALLDPAERQHVDSGGLLLREIGMKDEESDFTIDEKTSFPKNKPCPFCNSGKNFKNCCMKKLKTEK